MKKESFVCSICKEKLFLRLSYKPNASGQYFDVYTCPIHKHDVIVDIEEEDV